jgi:Semialdehyde dehydrogenase, dimerisation domain
MRCQTQRHQIADNRSSQATAAQIMHSRFSNRWTCLFLTVLEICLPQITATCIRVPIMRAHAESINLEFERDVSEEEAVEVLSKAAGVSMINDRSANRCGIMISNVVIKHWSHGAPESLARSCRQGLLRLCDNLPRNLLQVPHAAGRDDAGRCLRRSCATRHIQIGRPRPGPVCVRRSDQEG